jgi:hypothetical protein
MLLCHDGEISLSVVLIIISTIKRRGCVGGSVMWVCVSLGCKARVGVYRCSCPVWVSCLLSVLSRCLTLMSISCGFRGEGQNNKMVCVCVCVCVCVGSPKEQRIGSTHVSTDF